MNNIVGIIIMLPLVILMSEFGASGIFIYLLCVVVIIGLIAWRQRMKEEEQTQILNGCIHSHIGELSLKHRQMTFSGAYGTMDNKKWEREQKRFIDIVFAPAVGGATALALKPEKIKAIIDHAVSKANAGVLEAESLSLADDASGTDYKVHCAELFEACGWDARMVGGSGDHGADIVATRNDFKLVAQCKYYTGNVGNGAVQEAASGRAFH